MCALQLCVIEPIFSVWERGLVKFADPILRHAYIGYSHQNNEQLDTHGCDSGFNEKISRRLVIPSEQKQRSQIFFKTLI